MSMHILFYHTLIKSISNINTLPNAFINHLFIKIEPHISQIVIVYSLYFQSLLSFISSLNFYLEFLGQSYFSISKK